MNPTNASHTICVIDDDSATRILIKEVLQDININVIESAKGKDALQLLKDYQRINLILLDIRLPDCLGHELLPKLRKIQPGVPVVAISASSITDLVNNYEARNFDGYISKPFDIDYFISFIKQFLNP